MLELVPTVAVSVPLLLLLAKPLRALVIGVVVIILVLLAGDRIRAIRILAPALLDSSGRRQDSNAPLSDTNRRRSRKPVLPSSPGEDV